MSKNSPKVGDTVVYRDGEGKYWHAKITDLSDVGVADLEYNSPTETVTGVPLSETNDRDSVWFVNNGLIPEESIHG